MNTQQKRQRRHAALREKAKARAGEFLLDLAGLAWNALRAYAASRGVPTHRRTRADIEADLSK